MPIFEKEQEDMLDAFCEHILPTYNGQAVQEYSYKTGGEKDGRYAKRADVVIFQYDPAALRERDRRQTTPLKSHSRMGQMYEYIRDVGETTYEELTDELSYEGEFYREGQYEFEILRDEGYIEVEDGVIRPVPRIPVLKTAICMELKRLRPHEGIEQAERSLDSFASRAYVVVDASHINRIADRRDELKEAGVGALALSEDGYELIQPPTRYVDHDHSERRDRFAYHALRTNRKKRLLKNRPIVSGNQKDSLTEDDIPDSYK